MPCGAIRQTAASTRLCIGGEDPLDLREQILRLEAVWKLSSLGFRS